MVVSDLEELPQYKAQLTCFINTETAGILDDCIIQKFPDHIWLVNNAINAKKISSLMKEKCINLPSSYDVSIDFESTGEGQGSCLIAIQGPRSEEAIRCIQNGETTRSLQNLSFGSGCPIHLLGEECYISRTGYTGEDGFEVHFLQS